MNINPVKLKTAERRLAALAEHIGLPGIYLSHNAVYKHYYHEKIKNTRENIPKVHHAEITLYKAAAVISKEL